MTRLCIALTMVVVLLVAHSNRDAHAQDGDSTYTVTVAAGDVDRMGTVVSFALPAPFSGSAYHLTDASGHTTPLQVGPQRAWFVLDSLSAGVERTYRIERGAAQEDPVSYRRDDEALAFSIDAEPVLQYWAQPRPLPRPDIDSLYLRGGYVHPIRTPSGRVVTGDYASGHLHHHALWAAWTNTAFRGRTPDFWNMGQGTGAVLPMALDSAWGGPVHGGLRARHRYVDKTAAEPVTALYEQWTLRVYDVTSTQAVFDYRLFDLIVKQATASASPLVLPTYHYGGVALRGRDAWYGADNARFLTSSGKTRANGNESRARWTYMGGAVDGTRAGIAMLGHPTNFRAPQPVRIHPEMPYFCFAPSQLGEWRIVPGRPYEARYRFVAFDGAPDAEMLDRLWRDYAYPPGATVRAAARSDR